MANCAVIDLLTLEGSVSVRATRYGMDTIASSAVAGSGLPPSWAAREETATSNARMVDAGEMLLANSSAASTAANATKPKG